MKKKISLLLGMLMFILCLTGCASTNETVEYDEATIEQATEFLIQYCQNADEETMEQWNSMSEYAQNYQLMMTGLPFTPESFAEAVESWKAGVDECGAYVSHGDYTFEADKDGLEVSVPVIYEERNATIVFVFDEEMYLDNMTVNAEYSLGEILKKAGLNTVLGMGTVFAVLIFISLIISLFKYIPALENALRRKPKQSQAPAPKESEIPVVAPVQEEADDLELIAVISAAIAAAEGTSSDGFVVRSIRRRPSNKWN